MKKTIQNFYTILYIFIFTTIPIHISNTNKRELNAMELKVLNENIKKNNIQYKIDIEYDLFFVNLDTLRTSKRAKAFIRKLMYDAIDSKSLPSIVISQASLETGYGKHNKLKNNLFGIKGRGIWTKTREFYKGRFITINAQFQYFPTVKDAFNRHNQILTRYGVYGRDYNVWISRLIACGYATDPNYDKKLNSIIDRFDLFRLDNIQNLNIQMNNIGVEECNPTTPIFV